MNSHLLKIQSLKSKIEALTPKGKLLSSLFPAQRKFLEDGAHLKAALCTRRAGKSHSAAAILYCSAISKPNTVALYLALTRRSAKAIMWHKLKEIDRQFSLGMKFSEADLIVTLPNDSRIVLFAADIENLSDRLRGDAYISVVIDEAQSYGTHLQYLIDDVLEPATLDHNGSIALIGTPGPIPAGVFYDATTKATAYATHRWSILDNSYLPHASDWLARLRSERGWTDENPTWRREYLGEWCQDDSALVYRGFKRFRNLYKGDLPTGSWNYIVGLDLGWHDQTAFSVVAYSKYYPNAYVIRSFGRSEMRISLVAEVLLSLQNEFAPIAIVADTGGLGKSICEELKARYSLPIVAAEKTEKLSAIEALNSDYIDGRVLIHESCVDLISQYETLTWDERRLHENPSIRNDLCLSEDTLVATNRGLLRIDCMDGSELVLTRSGYAQIDWIGQTGIQDTIRISLNGYSLECTRKHPVWTQRGFVQAENLSRGDVVWLLSNGMDITGTHQRNAEEKRIESTFHAFARMLMGAFLIYCFIEKFGKLILEKYLKAIKYTTRILIHIITTLITLNVYRLKSINKNIMRIQSGEVHQKHLCNILRRSGISQKSGMHQKKVENGTLNMGVRFFLKGTKKSILLSARFVELISGSRKFVQPIFEYAQINAAQKLDATLAWITSQSYAANVGLRLCLINTEKSNIVLEVAPARLQIPVFNLKTKALPEFFANGILVHNCDGALYPLRYSRHYWHRPKVELSPDQLLAQQERDMLDKALQQQRNLIEERDNESRGIGSDFETHAPVWSNSAEVW